jgi:hypothetical protein
MSYRPGLGRALSILVLLALSAGGIEAQGKTRASREGFRLFARAGALMEVNRVACGVIAIGELCVDHTNSTVIGGGYWPKNSPQMYVYNSGLQLAGAIQAGIAGFAWSGDTTGAFFFDPKGTTVHGSMLEPAWNYSLAEDRASWPAMARVPATGPSAATYAPVLRGRNSASEGDLWMLAWEGDTTSMAGRPHPLGVAVETRTMGWNQPKWNEDIVYFVHTIYNISSACPADYAQYEAPLRDRLLELGRQFQARNNARFGIVIPECGYDLHSLYAANSMDADVSEDAGENFASVNLPLGVGYAYQDFFRPTRSGYQLPPDLRTAPFLNGYGFVGVKFLETPLSDSVDGGIRLYTNTTGGGVFGDPQNVRQLWRYLSGNITPALGDGACNRGDQRLTRICLVREDNHSDIRHFQTTGPAALAPGDGLTFAVAYLFASAAASPACPGSPCAFSVKPGEPRRLTSVDSLLIGANLVDSMTGFRGYVDDNGDDVVQGREFRTVRGSLLHKAQLAQVIFDQGFLLPSAPTAPDFFLVPGDNNVAVLWRPSATETEGDPFFTLSSDPTSAAYDPNFRRFDTEGYRIYRGRVDAPSQLTLIAQYDHAREDSRGHPLVMRDHLGTVAPNGECAPELGRNTVGEGCPIDFDTPVAGSPYTAYVEQNIQSHFAQVRLGDRFLDASGLPYLIAVDTAVTGGGSGLPEIWDTGVPFVHVDSTARNNLRYFYTVTAFDVNSIQSGPSSLESARIVKSVTPVRPASNYGHEGSWTVRPRGRGVFLDPTAAMPTLDSVTGIFSGRMPPADAATLGLVGPFLEEVLAGSGEFFVRLDSLDLGQVDMTTCCVGGGPGIPVRYHLTVSDGTNSTRVVMPIEQELGGFGFTSSAETRFTGIPVHSTYGAKYGGSTAFGLMASFRSEIQPLGYAGGAGAAAGLSQQGFQSFNFSSVGTTGMRYDGVRWYAGANETSAHPTAGQCGIGTLACALTNMANFNNAGAVTGATLVYMPKGYLNFNREWRNVEAVLGGARRAADLRVYWGASGVVDSVVDLTHNVQVPFEGDRMSAGWGILNVAGQGAAGSWDQRPGVVTPLDFMCVEPLRSYAPGMNATSGPFFPCASAAPFTLSASATLGPVAVGVGDNQSVTNPGSVRNTTNLNGGNGFAMYLAGTITFFGGMTVPPANTTWTLRSYSGAVFGGNPPAGIPGNLGPYRFISRPRPMTAVGSELVFSYTVAQNRTSATVADLERVHTVPDPYYLTNPYESDAAHKVIKFVNLPDRANIRIYSLSGVLVRVIEHNSSTFGGQADWDVRNSGGRLVASGVYFYHIEAESGARRVGRMTLVTDGN